MRRRDDGIDVQGKAPSFPFYPADFMRDMQTCTAAARGVWITLLCEMHFASRRGYLVHANGLPWTVEEVARLVHLPVHNTRLIMDELRRKGIFSELPVDSEKSESIPPTMDREKSKPATIIYSRRMAKDAAISEARRKAVNSRYSKQLSGDGGNDHAEIDCQTSLDFVGTKPGTKRLQNGLLSSSSSFSSCLSSSSSNGESLDAETNSEREPVAPGSSRVPHATRIPDDLALTVERVLAEFVDAAKLSLALPPPAATVRRISHLLIQGRVRDPEKAFEEFMLAIFDDHPSPRKWRWFEAVVEKAIKEQKFEQIC